MDLLIQNATFEQITAICSRIASPSFDEMVDDERIGEIAKRVNAGESVQDAKLKWQEDIEDRAMATVDPDGTKRITRDEIKRELGSVESSPEPDVKTEVTRIPGQQTAFGDAGSEDLHLDGPPPDDTITLDAVMKLATDVAKAGKMDFVRALVKEFKVKKVKHLKPEQLEPAYRKLSEALNG